MRISWITACAVGEGLGIAAVATVYAAIDRGILTSPMTAILLAGAWEGLCLGAGQAFVLRRPGISPSAWIVATVAAAVVGYALSLIGQSGVQDRDDSQVGTLVMLGLGACVGIVIGALMGAVQLAAASGKLRAVAWISANAIGWAPAMATIMLAAASVERHWPLYVITICGAVAGALAGIFVGTATSFALPRAAAPKSPRAVRSI